jgi:hypothetical protein
VCIPHYYNFLMMFHTSVLGSSTIISLSFLARLLSKFVFVSHEMHIDEYNDYAGKSRVRIPIGQEIYLFSKTCKLTLGLTQPPLQWVSGFFPGGREAGV